MNMNMLHATCLTVLFPAELLAESVFYFSALPVSISRLLMAVHSNLVVELDRAHEQIALPASLLIKQVCELCKSCL